MNCHRVQNLLSAYLDQEISSEERRLIRNHIFNCPVCSQNYDELSMVKSFLGNLEPPAPEIDPLVKFSFSHQELFSHGSHYTSLLWGKRLLLTGSCVFLFLLTSFSLFPVTGPTGIVRRLEVTTLVPKPTRNQFVKQQNVNLLVGDPEEDEKKGIEKIEPWWDDSLYLPVIPVSR